jgi:tyrosyl-tRNA synthetase
LVFTNTDDYDEMIPKKYIFKYLDSKIVNKTIMKLINIQRREKQNNNYMPPAFVVFDDCLDMNFSTPFFRRFISECVGHYNISTLDPKKIEVRRNSEWFGKMSFLDALNLSRQMTVAQMLVRDDFAKRYSEQTPISIVEFLYPLLQGHDSVMLKADIEIGGSDQLFNMMVGRDLQEKAGQPPQAVLGMPLLVGLDGEKKMSKSLGNYIAFNENPKDMFGKIMSVPDDTMWVYYQLLLECSDEEIKSLQAQHPMEMKKQLAVKLTDKFHGTGAGAKERQEFETVFSKGGVRTDMPEFSWDALSAGANEAGIVDLLAATGLFPSKKEVRRLIEGGAVKIGDEKVSDPALKISRPTSEIIIQAGKRTFVKIK